MKAWKMKLRLVALMTGLCCCAATNVRAQGPTVTVSPGNLSFGVPGVTTGVPSAPETVTISVGGTGTATVSSINISPTLVNNEAIPSQDFMETDTCGTNPSGSNMIAAPGSCTISVTFKPSQAAGILESSTLTLMVTGNDPFHIPLTGALGAIRLFDPLNVALSRSGLTDSSPLTFAATNVVLSCTAPSTTGTLSSSPDGIGNVLVDNFLTVAVNNHTISGTGGPAGNVCAGGQVESDGVSQDCFTTNYQVPAGSGSSLDGDDPDAFTNSGNNFLTQQSPNTNNAGGVPPIVVASSLTSGAMTTFSLLDGGGKVTSTTLFLVTNCSLTNANTGSETGNPTNQQPSQTLSFDTVVGNLDQYAFDYSLIPLGSITNPDATPTVTNKSISPTDYKNLVTETPFQNTACIPLKSLNGNCALKTQVCTLSNNSVASGANCPQSGPPDFLFTATFDPVSNITDPTTIFGFLEFNDAGTCTGGLAGPETNNSCPQNGLVSFTGPGEYSGRRGAGSTNSSEIVVTGVNPPTTTVVVSPFFPKGPSSGWTNQSPQVTFTGNPGTSTPVVAPVNFIEYGINPSPGLPPTFPIPFTGNASFGPDTVKFNTACPQGSNPYTATAPPFTPPPVSFGPFTDGQSNVLHYSTTDCATTHELLFTLNPVTGGGSAWSTSFKSLTLMTDTLPPGINVTTPANGATYSANQKVKAAYVCTDPESGVASCKGPVSSNTNIDTTPTMGLTTAKSFTVTSADNVGNTAIPTTVNYFVSCSYAAVTINPPSVNRPAFVGVTASLTDCMSAPQNVKVQFSLSGPIGRKCSNSSAVLFTTPTFTIKSGTSNSFTFPFPIGRDACVGTYTFTTTTLQGANNTVIDTVSSTLMVN